MAREPYLSRGKRAVACAALLAVFILPASARASSPCARSLGNGVVARLCQPTAAQTSARHKVVIHATGYRLAAKRGAVELRGTTPLRTGLGVRVNALRMKGTKIELLYTHSGGEWLARFSRLNGHGALRGKVVSHWTGSRLQVRLHVGRRSVRTSSLKQLKAVTPKPGPLPLLPAADALRSPLLDTSGGSGCATPDAGMDSFWSRSGPGWTGGDSAYSTLLPDGRTAWFFGDTFLGNVAADGSRPANTPMVHNSIVLQSGDQIATQTSVGPSAFVNTPDGSGWYWPGAETVENSKLILFLSRFHGSGLGWDFTYDSTALATLSLPDLKLQSLAPVADAGGLVHWGSWTFTDGGYTYVYGTETSGLDNWLHVARVLTGQLTTGPWEYWNGSAWSADQASTARVLDGVSNQLSVVRHGSAYVLISQNVALSRVISAWESPTPLGPWTNKTTVYTTPSWPDSFTYNAVAHPELSDGATLLVSYNVNSSSGTGAYKNADLYRPRFIRVPMSCLPGA